MLKHQINICMFKSSSSLLPQTQFYFQGVTKFAQVIYTIQIFAQKNIYDTRYIHITYTIYYHLNPNSTNLFKKKKIKQIV